MSSSDERRVIVIGSGPTGLAVTLSLLRRGIPVTMLESGRRFRPGLLLRAAGRTLLRLQPHLGQAPHAATGDPETAWFHALTPGGLSNHWTGAVPRFAPEDFADGARLHERYRWPVSYGDLVPYYEQVERLLGVEGTRASVPLLPEQHIAHPCQLPVGWHRVARHAAACGQGLTALPLAAGPAWGVAGRGTGFNSFTLVTRLCRRFPHFQLLLGAHALRLEWDGAVRKVSGVVYADRGDGSRHRIAGAAVAVAAGPLASTKLLFNSACPDFPDGMGNTEGLLGRFLHDHAMAWAVFEVDRPLPRLNHPAYLTRLPYADSLPLLAASCTIGAASLQQKVLLMASAPTHTFGVAIFGAMIPTEQHFLRLETSLRDEFGLPGLDIHIRFDEATLQNLTRAGERLSTLLAEAGHRSRVTWGGERAVPGASVHYGGTVRMHRSEQFGVLNAWNRLHAVSNVAVVDGSCFTTGAEKNPTLTAMALAMRAGDRLAADLKRDCV